MFLFGLLLAVFYSSHGIRSIRGHTMTMGSHGQILHNILEDYDRRILPIPKDGGPVIMKIGLALQQVINLDQKTEMLVLSIWVRIYWNDPQLSWDPETYNGTETVYIPNDQHWVPDLVFFDNANIEYPEIPEHIPTTVSYDGNITYMYPAVIKCACPQNIKTFPMDTQKCQLKFGSWALGGDALYLTTMDENAADFNLIHMKSNHEWNVKDFTALATTNYYGCCTYPYHDVLFTLTLSRNWQMIFLYLYIPNIFINILTIVQFLLPCHSSERCTLGITLFLSVIVYLLLLNGVLPNSDSIPIIIVYLSTTLILNGVSLILTILLLWLHYCGTHDNHNALPQYARKYILHYLARILRMHQFITPDNEHDANLRDFQSTVGLDEDEEGEEVELLSETIGHKEAQLSSDERKPETILRTRSHIKTGHGFTRAIRPDQHFDSQPGKSHDSDKLHGKVQFQDDHNKHKSEDAIANLNAINVHVVDNKAENMPAQFSRSHGIDSSNSLKCENEQVNRSRSSYASISGKDGSKIKVKVLLVDNIAGLNKTTHNSNKTLRGSVIHTELTSNEGILLFQLLKHLEDLKAQLTAQTKDNELQSEWMQVAMVLNRLMFYLYFIATGLMAIYVIAALAE